MGLERFSDTDEDGFNNATVAQSVERESEKLRVPGSTPGGGTILSRRNIGMVGHAEARIPEHSLVKICTGSVSAVL